MSFSQPTAAPKPNATAATVGALVAGIAGAALWALITAVTKFQIGWFAIGIGVLVGFAAVRGAGGPSATVGRIAALVALATTAFGDVLAQELFVSRDLHIPLSTVMTVSPITVFRLDVKDSPMILAFIAIAAVAAFRVGSTGAYGRRVVTRPAPAGVQVPPSYQAVPPSYQAVPPSYQGVPPSYQGVPPQGAPLQNGPAQPIMPPPVTPFGDTVPPAPQD